MDVILNNEDLSSFYHEGKIGLAIYVMADLTNGQSPTLQGQYFRSTPPVGSSGLKYILLKRNV